MNDPGILGAFVEALGWTLLHFLWQGLVIGAVYACAMAMLKGASSSARYWTGMLTLAAMFAAPVLTMSVQLDVATSALGAAATPAVMAGSMTVPASAPGLLAVAEQRVEAALPWAVLAWFVGVMILSGRLALDFVRIRRLAMVDVRPLSPGLQRAVDRLIDSLQINSAVRVLESARVAVPMVVGWLRPVILLPPSALMGLTPHQLELIVSHELAHVKRLDYLFNLLQIVVETLLFYHPVVRMVSIRVRMERENCCDDIVVARTGDSLAYARALTEVEGLRCSSGMQLSLAATGGHLRGRVTRLVAAPAPQRGAVHWVAGLVLLATGLGAVSGARVALQEPPALAPVSPLDTPPTAPAAPVVDAQPVVPPSPAPGLAVAGPQVPPAKAAAIAPESPPVAPTHMRSVKPARHDGGPQAAGPASPETQPLATAVSSAASPAPVDDAGETPAAPPAPVAPPIRVATIQAPVSAPAMADPERIAPRPAVGPEGAGTDAGPEVQQPAPAPIPSSVDAAIEESPAPPPGQGASPLEPVEPPPPRVTGGALIKSPPPAYPRRARLSGQRGFVTARYTVDAKGRVRDVTIVESTASMFERPVRRSLRKWRYEPFLADGEPVKLTLERTFEFDLEGASFADRERNVRCAKVTGSRLCRSRTGYDDLGVVVVYNDR